MHATHRAASRRPVILLFIAVPETFRALRGWMEPTVPENYFQLRPGYTPGDLDFDPLGLKPEDPEALKEMQTKESRTASKTTTLLYVCVASMAWSRVVCLLWLFVYRVCRASMRENSCLCVVVVCRVSRSCRGSMRELVPRLTRAVSRRLQHGRLAMLAAAGMIVQELQTGATLF